MPLASVIAVTLLLECRLQAPAEVAQGAPVPVTFTLANQGKGRVSVLDWHTPLEGLLSEVFTVTRDGEPVAYGGPMVKRGDPDADEYHALPPGESLSETVDASLAWDFSRPGRYRITFRGPLRDVTDAPVPRPRDAHQPLPLSCPAVEVVRR